MLVCRPRGDYGRKWKISAAFNVSQKDRVPLELLRDTLACGSIRRAGNGGWYWEVNRLSDLQSRVVPFFERFPLVGLKAQDFELWSQAVGLLEIVEIAQTMNRRKARPDLVRILRGHTPEVQDTGS